MEARWSSADTSGTQTRGEVEARVRADGWSGRPATPHPLVNRTSSSPSQPIFGVSGRHFST